MTNLSTPSATHWRRVNRLVAKSRNGMEVNLDPRGLVRLCKPNGDYLVFPLDYADGGESIDSVRNGPPSTKRPVQVWIQEASFLWKSRDGNPVGCKMATDEKKASRDAVFAGLGALGFTVVEVEPTSDGEEPVESHLPS